MPCWRRCGLRQWLNQYLSSYQYLKPNISTLKLPREGTQDSWAQLSPQFAMAWGSAAMNLLLY